MAAVTRNNIDPSAGHCYGPRPTDDAGQTTVFVNNQLAVVVGGHYLTHSCGNSSHDGNASSGSSSVFIANLSVHRIGDDISCGDVSASGSPNVFVG